MRVLLAVVAAVVALALVPSGSSARPTAPSIDLTSVTFTPSLLGGGLCSPIWHFTVQGVTASKHAPWRARGTESPGQGSGFTFTDLVTRADNGQSLAITDTFGDDVVLANSGVSRHYQLTLFNATQSTVEATSQVVSATDPATSSC
jgi:hypothetical protein